MTRRRRSRSRLSRVSIEAKKIRIKRKLQREMQAMEDEENAHLRTQQLYSSLNLCSQLQTSNNWDAQMFEGVVVKKEPEWEDVVVKKEWEVPVTEVINPDTQPIDDTVHQVKEELVLCPDILQPRYKPTADSDEDRVIKSEIAEDDGAGDEDHSAPSLSDAVSGLMPHAEGTHDDISGGRVQVATHTRDACAEQLPGKTALIDHVQSSHGPDTQENSPEKLFIEQQQTHTSETVKANEKNRDAKLYTNLNKDKANIEQKPFACDLCNKSYTLNSTLRKHFRTSHTGEKPYKCDICNKQFRQNYVLKKHSLIHTGLKPHKCDICQKQFTCKGDLTTHSRTHTGEKPYKCEICNRQFSDRGSVIRHVSIHTGYKPHKCEVCNKHFNNTTNLKIHMKIHTEFKPYTCEICNKQFKYKSSWRMHDVVHNKPYKCEICNKQYPTTSSLEDHTKTHTEIYMCEICNKQFKYKCGLSRHVKRHTIKTET